MEILVQKQWDYTLSKSYNGDLLLSVMCGSVGLHEFEMILNQDETDGYSKMGELYIDQLAKMIQSNPAEWTLRKIIQLNKK